MNTFITCRLAFFCHAKCLNLIQGSPGRDGEMGAMGQPGPSGDPGQPGLPGLTGSPGIQVLNSLNLLLLQKYVYLSIYPCNFKFVKRDPS